LGENKSVRQTGFLKEAEMTTRDVERIRFATQHFNDLQGFRFLVPLGLITLSLGGATYFSNLPFVILRAAFLLGGLGMLLGSKRYYRRRFGEVERQPARAAVVDSLSIYSPAGAPQRLAVEPLLHPAAARALIVLGLTFVLVLILRPIGPLVTFETDDSLVEKPWLILHSGITFFLGGAVPEEVWGTLRLQMLYALYGSVFLGIWLWRRCRLSQSHHLILGLLLLGLSALGSSLGFFLSVPWGRGIFNVVLPAVAYLWVVLLLCGASTVLAGLIDHRQLARVLRPVGGEA
jgi:hypothetical protein